jgi:hypothetical protein
VAVKEIRATEKKPCTLHQNNRKDPLRASQELSGSNQFKAQGKCFT